MSDDKTVVVNPKTKIYHDVNSHNGRKVLIPNKDGSQGKAMPESEAVKISRKSKK